MQSEPVDGAKPTEKTTVWIAYDDKAVYVAARLYDSEPKKIISLLGRRDDQVDSDWFLFSVDPYYDHRTGFQFAVNPANTIVDWTLYNDEWNDITWDGVWESAAKIDTQGWTVEMRIPYNQLRFEKKDSYVWGVNFKRVIKRKNENDSFIWIPKEESGFVSRFANLEGIANINPGRLIELLPFAVAKETVSPAEEGNPFQTGRKFLGDAGLDSKIGIKSNLILDMTINPDFGQVEVDPAVINLSAYETYYDEKRPFFIEGANIFEFGRGGSNSYWSFNWGNPSFFYSRRIGRAPQGSVSNDNAFANIPPWTTILGAGKLTGQISNGWKIGLLSVVTQPEYAELALDGDRRKEEVEPLTYFGVVRSQNQFNDGRQGVGFLFTSVIRDLRTQSLKDLLNRDALGFGVDSWTTLDKNKTWVLTGWTGGTFISGSKENIFNLQQSSLHYFQRPDASQVHLNDQATSMSGWAGRYALNKQKGNFVFNAALGFISPGFDSTDLGFEYHGDIINEHVVAGYQSFHPEKIFRSWMITVFDSNTFNFGGTRKTNMFGAMANWQFLNYWLGTLNLFYFPDQWSDNVTRGGPLMLDPSSLSTSVSLHSDSRKSVVTMFGGSYGSGRSTYRLKDVYFAIRWKPRSNISFYFGPEYIFQHSVIQYIDTFDDALMDATYSKRYIFASIDQHTVQAEIRADITFRPNLTLQLYMQPFIAVGKYSRFKEFAHPHTFDFNFFGDNNSTITYADDVYTVDPDGPGPASPFSFDNPDFNYKSLRGTVVLRWEFKLGSTLYLVWTQNRENNDNPGDFSFKRDFHDLIRATGDNIFLIKFSYRFNV